MTQPDYPEPVRFGSVDNPIRDGHHEIPRWDPDTQAHLWIVGVIYGVVGAEWANNTMLLTPNAVLSAQGPGCWYCHARICDYAIRQLCPGKPPKPSGRLRRLRGQLRGH